MNEFDDKDDEMIERSNRLTFHRIVVDHLFPRIKFLDKNEDLEYSNEPGTICHFIFHKCYLQYQSMTEEVLWEKAKKWIKSSITRLRSDKCTAIRNEFYSK